MENEHFVCLLTGFIIGMFVMIGVVSCDSSIYAAKDKLEKKRTIPMGEYFVQYSAVRRFPK